MAARLPLLDPAKAKDLASVFFDNAQFDTVDPQPSYMPNFDAANPQAPPKETTQYGISTFDTATPERQDTQVERAAARWRLANLPANYQYHPEDLAGNAPLSQEKADRSLLGDTVLAHTGEPALASLASLFDPLSPSDPLDTGIPGINPGKIAPAIFLGIGAKTADKKAYKLANEMEKAGRHPEVIRQMTGWQRAADGNWKFEISDANAKLTGVQKGSLKEVFDHPELYAAHPEIGETRVSIGGPGGSYYQPGGNGAIKTLPVINISKNAKNPLDPMIHEVQHDVQDRSGFAPGANNFAANLKPGNPAWDIYQEKLAKAPTQTLGFLLHGRTKPITPARDAQIREEALMEYYRRSAGENESNAATDRRAMPQEDLKKIPPQAFEAFPRDQQIVMPPRVPGNKAPEPQLQVDDSMKFVGPPPAATSSTVDLFDPKTLNPNEDPAVARERLRQFYGRASEQMNLKPEDRFQPDPSHQVIDTDYKTPPPIVGPLQDLSQLYPRHPDPAAELPNFDRARIFVTHKEKVAQAITKKIRKSGVMNSDARYFYGSAGPLFRGAQKAGLTLNEALAYIRDFGHNVGSTSPRTRVVPNVKNATSSMAKTAAGIPHREIVGPGSTTKEGLPGSSEHGFPMMTNIEKPAENLHGHLLDVTNAGENIDPNIHPKPAIFDPQVGQGNLSGVTVDTHVIRGAVQTFNELHPGQLPLEWIKKEHRAAYLAKPKTLTPDMIDDSLGSQMVNGKRMQTEFPILADVYHRVAQILKVDPGEAQAMGWFGMGGATNLGSDLETIAKVFNDRVSVTAQALGKTPDEIAQLAFRRKIPLMSILGGAVTGAAALGAAGQQQNQSPGGT